MILREWTKRQGIDPQTASRWFWGGTLPVPATKMGKLILVTNVGSRPGRAAGRNIIEATVFSADQQADLDGQVATFR